MQLENFQVVTLYGSSQYYFNSLAPFFTKLRAYLPFHYKAGQLVIAILIQIQV